MMARALIGLQWGDEGKGKMVDLLAAEADFVVRCQGGSNAGHTVWVGGKKTVLHLIPSGILSPTVRCLVGHGVVLDPEQFLREVENLEAHGVEVKDRLFISDRAHLVFPWHRQLDSAQESRRASSKIGTTGKGIGPSYEDKIARIGLRVCDLVRKEGLRDVIESAVAAKTLRLTGHGMDLPNIDELYEFAVGLSDALAPYVCNGVEMLHRACEDGERVFLEGAQGSMLDIDLGTYPFVTSSNANIGGLLSGSGLSPSFLGTVIGVSKAYATRVGSGPFPTELEDEVGDRLRERGNEFGSTTGRPRRCGWFDGPAARFAVQVNGIQEIALTKVDVMSGFDEIKVATEYRDREGKAAPMPGSAAQFESLSVHYETYPGWSEDVGEVRRFEDLPSALKNYVSVVENLVGSYVRWVSVGPGREDIVDRGARSQ